MVILKLIRIRGIRFMTRSTRFSIAYTIDCQLNSCQSTCEGYIHRYRCRFEINFTNFLFFCYNTPDDEVARRSKTHFKHGVECFFFNSVIKYSLLNKRHLYRECFFELWMSDTQTIVCYAGTNFIVIYANFSHAQTLDTFVSFGRRLAKGIWYASNYMGVFSPPEANNPYRLWRKRCIRCRYGVYIYIYLKIKLDINYDGRLFVLLAVPLGK